MWLGCSSVAEVLAWLVQAPRPMKRKLQYLYAQVYIGPTVCIKERHTTRLWLGVGFGQREARKRWLGWEERGGRVPSSLLWVPV